MDTQQIADYLEKYNLKTKEQLASHIEQLKCNTKPNIALISELVWTLEDSSSFFNSFCAEKINKTDFYEACENTLKNITLNNHISEVINDEQQERRSAEHIDEVLEWMDFNEKGENFGEVIGFKNILEEWIKSATEQIPAEKTENKGMSTRHKAHQEKQVIEDWNRNEDDKNIKASHLSINGEFGKKETENKVDYSEIDWEFIEAQALRMNKNKGKYEVGNYKKPMNIDNLKQSLLRHVIEVLKDNYQDDEDSLGHLSAIALNAQFLYYQLKNQ